MGKQSNSNIALDYGKIPPQATEIEEAILGALILEGDSYSRVSHLLKDPSVFYKEAHQIILEAIISLYNEGIGIDLLLIVERLRKMEKLESVGGAVYISQLMSRIASDKHLIFHCTVITDKFLLRELIRIGSHMQEKAFDETSDPNDIAEWAEEELQKKFDLDIEGRATFKDALIATLLDISNKQKGIVNTFIRSGDEQIDNKLSLRSRQICLIAGAEGVGKCFGKNTSILMFDHSTKMIQDIIVGDVLMGPDGSSRIVKNLGSGSSKLYKVNQQKGCSYIVNEGHILSTKFIGRLYQHKRTKIKTRRNCGKIVNLTIEDYLSKFKNWRYLHKGYKGIGSEFHKSVRISPYFLGLWLGDGSNQCPQITTNDLEIFSYLKDKLDANDVSGKRPNDCKSFYISGMKDAFNSYSLFHNKHIPIDYLKNTRQIKLELLAGLLDSDGHMIMRKPKNASNISKPISACYEITLKNEKLIDDIIQLCRSLGFYVKKSIKLATIKSINYSCLVHRLIIASNNLYEIPCKIKRKIAPKINRPYDPTLSTLNIETAGYGDYYGITVDKDELFMLKDYTVVHNSKYSAHLSKGILDNNDDAHLLWFSMEDSKEQIVRSFISRSTMITTKHLQSINYTLTDDDMKKVNDAVSKFKEYGIEFVDRVCSIRTIVRKIKQFRDRYPIGPMIIIIDNLGLITTDSYYKGIEKDDYLAAKIKDICDQTDSLVLLLHHMTKEGAKALNLKDGYRPRKEHIRGSSRILDYVQQCILLNLPSKYKDLVLQEKDKKKLFNLKQRTGKFDFTRFLMEFWIINPKADKLTKNISDLRQATWNELKFACSEEKMPDGTAMGVGFILNKYIEYSVYIDDVNRPRETKYHKEKVAIHTFITKKMFNENYSPENNSRTHYLYGDNLKLALKLKQIFIAEIVKNRDGEDDEDHNIMRYESDLGYNIFKSLI